MSDLRRNLQVAQPNVAQPPEGNGWPEPLSDNSNPLGIKVTNGRNGETTVGPKVSTSQQDKGEHHTPETGEPGPTAKTEPGALSGPLSSPETYSPNDDNNGFVGSDRADVSGIPKTSQQLRGDFSLPEGK